MYDIKNGALVLTTQAEIPADVLRRLATLNQIGRRFGRSFTRDFLAGLNEFPGDEPSVGYGLEQFEFLPDPRFYMAELVLDGHGWEVHDGCHGEWDILIDMMRNLDREKNWPSTKAEKELAAQFLAACGALDTKAARRLGKRLSAVVGSRLGIP